MHGRTLDMGYTLSCFDSTGGAAAEGAIKTAEGVPISTMC